MIVDPKTIGVKLVEVPMKRETFILSGSDFSQVGPIRGSRHV